MTEEIKELSDRIVPLKAGIEWSVHPLKKNPTNSVLLVLFLVLLLVLVYLAFENIVFVFVSAVLLAVSLLKFFLPTSYVFTESEIKVSGPLGKTVRNWAVFKSFYPDKNGVLLSPFSEKNRLENFRGIYLLLGDDREPVLKFIEAKIKHE
ncbi:MAG: hypothetical protein AAB019_03245 [Planctomycetota bacterium]